MLFVVMAVAGGLAAGFALGGSLRRLEATRPRRGWVLAAAVGLQVAGAFVATGWAYAATLVVSFVMATAFLGANPRLAGRGLLVAGLGLNALVIGVNAAMPVSASAAARAGIRAGVLAADPRHAVADGGTHLALLEDRIPLPLPWQPQVLSPGDVLVTAGAALLVAQAMRRRTTTPPPVRPAATTRPELPTRPRWPPRSGAPPREALPPETHARGAQAKSA